MSYHGILADVEAIESAIEALPTQCLYHGGQFGRKEPFDTYRGEACCASGEGAYWRQRATAALKRLRENL